MNYLPMKPGKAGKKSQNRIRCSEEAVDGLHGQHLPLAHGIVVVAKKLAKDARLSQLLEFDFAGT